MKESELKQFLYEHPELLDDAFQTSLTEADRWAKEHPRSAAELIRRAKAAHPEIASEQWTTFEKAAAKAEQKQSPKGGRTFRLRWWQIAVAAVLILVLTFTLVPPARAWAESVIQYIVHIFDGGIDIQEEGEINIHRTPSPEELVPPTEDDSDLVSFETSYPDLSSFSDDTGYKPVQLVSDAFRVVDIEYQSYQDLFDQLLVTYESPNGVQIHIWQVWGYARGGTIFENEDDKLVQTTALDGKQVIGYVDTINGECVLEILLEESNMTIMYQGDLDYQTVLDALQYS